QSLCAFLLPPPHTAPLPPSYPQMVFHHSSPLLPFVFPVLCSTPKPTSLLFPSDIHTPKTCSKSVLWHTQPYSLHKIVQEYLSRIKIQFPAPFHQLPSPETEISELSSTPSNCCLHSLLRLLFDSSNKQ